MVKVGFIVEGDTEKIIFESDPFQSFLKGLNLQCVGIFNATGRGNLKNPNPTISSFFEILKDRQVNKVFIVADLEENPCVAQAKEELHVFDNAIQTTIVVVKAIESWFLADSTAISQMLKSKIYINEPEKMEGRPFDHLSFLALKYIGRGIGNKKIFAKQILRFGFSIQQAACHPNCKSAKYFIEQLRKVN